MTSLRRLIASAWTLVGLPFLIIAASFAGFVVLGVTDSTDQEARYIRVLWGAVAYLSMAVNLLLASRLSIIEDIFGGLDIAYKQHRQLGILALVAAIAHYWSPPIFSDVNCTGICAQLIGPAVLAGQVAFVVLVVFGVVSIARRYKIKGWQLPYGIWKASHWAMLLVFLAATFHLLQMPKMPLGYRNFATLLGYAGIFAFLIYLLGHILRLRRSYKYEVVSVIRQGDVTILEARPVGALLKHRAGQFAFLKFTTKGLKEAHPFTISSGDNDENIQFCVKTAGDFTKQLYANLAVGDKAIIEGPYGRFARKRHANETWIAAGIGVTPFLSIIKSEKPKSGQSVDFTYICRNVGEGLEEQILKDFSTKDGVSLRWHHSSLDGRWHEKKLDSETQILLVCGPTHLKRRLRSLGVPVKSEDFEFN